MTGPADKKSPAVAPGPEKPAYVVALAGNANVGKSATFNQLTGTGQEIGNWPGKTVEWVEGILRHRGHRLRVIDLPGIYSFATLSPEEHVTREFITQDRPDVVVNIIEASALERNLFFTLQLMELSCPLVIALNQSDLAAKKGIRIDEEKLSGLLGVPVVSTVAIRGIGIAELSDAVVAAVHSPPRPHTVFYGREVEDCIQKIAVLLPEDGSGYTPRWTAIKLLEGDPDVVWSIRKLSPDTEKTTSACREDLERLHGEPAPLVMSRERYHAAERIARKVMDILSPHDHAASFSERLDRVALHPVAGYLLLVLVIGGLLFWTFFIGSQVSDALTAFLSGIAPVHPLAGGTAADILFNGAWTGLVAALTLIIPYVVPFFLYLALIEDIGLLPRFSVLLDRGLHFLGLHGKALIPLILGFGCSVPACISCRIIESPKQKFLTAFLVTLVPCSARTVVILGVVAAFVGIWWAMALYLFDLVLIIIIGRFAFRVLPGESVGMIMEMPEYHLPWIPVVCAQTWARTRSLLWIVIPSYIIGSIAVTAAYAAGLLGPVNALLSPATVGLLGLPAVTGIVFIFGIIRKEMTILTLAALFGTTVFSTDLTPVQLIVIALVTMIYIPCLSTIIALAHEFSWRRALAISGLEVMLGIGVGAVAYRLLSLVM